MNAKSQSKFVCISKDKWVLSDKIEKSRRQRLMSETSFEKIVERISKKVKGVEYKGEQLGEKLREQLHLNTHYYRIVMELEMDSKTVDLFHNSVCGYRAQYYCSVENGERANKYATKLLASLVTKSLSGKSELECPLWLVEKSLSDVHAKVWIHQGRWLRNARIKDRNLQVKRWVDQQQLSPDKKKRKKARWASLTPDRETRIDLKGAYFTIDGKPLGVSTKPCRGCEIHEYGFT